MGFFEKDLVSPCFAFFLAERAGVISNSLFDILEEWNTHLKTAGIECTPEAVDEFNAAVAQVCDHPFETGQKDAPDGPELGGPQ